MDEQRAAGWLVFECEREKRRLMPIPVGWAKLSDAELIVLCASAPVAPRHTRRFLREGD
jgi:hypothetical protein